MVATIKTVTTVAHVKKLVDSLIIIQAMALVDGPGASRRVDKALVGVQLINKVPLCRVKDPWRRGGMECPWQRYR
jgi:hypothetical protein